MRSKGVVRNAWPAWRYGPDGQSEIFDKEEDVPEGWTRKPGDEPPVLTLPESIVLNKDELVAELCRLKIEIKPSWGNLHMKRILDGDISPTW